MPERPLSLNLAEARMEATRPSLIMGRESAFLDALAPFFPLCGTGSLFSRGHDRAFLPGLGARVQHALRMLA